MTSPPRAPRAVYRVYSEEEYLAGVDPFADTGRAAVTQAGQARALQRLMVGAALTGAVGTVGGMVGIATLHGHAARGRQTARSAARSARVRPGGVGVGVGVGGEAGAPQMRRLHVTPWRGSSPSAANERAPTGNGLGPARRLQTHTVVAGPIRRVGEAARTLAVDLPSELPVIQRESVAGVRPASAPAPESAPVASADRGASAQAQSPPREQREFGFER